MTDHYAVVGNPVAHSRSPQIHAEFARQTGQDIDYARLFAPLDQFAATVRKFRDEGGKGLNVSRALAQNGTATRAVLPIGGVYGGWEFRVSSSIEGTSIRRGTIRSKRRKKRFRTEVLARRIIWL